MLDCKNCSNLEWKNHYTMAQERFDKQIAKLTVIVIISFFVVVICLIATIIVIVKFQLFISEFEYVEETTYSIEQDDGVNTAIIGGESNEVNIYGTENNRN